MIRKQFYIAPAQQRKLRALAARSNCTEAEIVRRALDRLAETDDSVAERLREAGLLVEPPDDPDLPPLSELPALEREFRAWAQSRSEPLGLSEAVMEDRR